MTLSLYHYCIIPFQLFFSSLQFYFVPTSRDICSLKVISLTFYCKPKHNGGPCGVVKMHLRNAAHTPPTPALVGKNPPAHFCNFLHLNPSIWKLRPRTQYSNLNHLCFLLSRSCFPYLYTSFLRLLHTLCSLSLSKDILNIVSLHYILFNNSISLSILCLFPFSCFHVSVPLSTLSIPPFFNVSFPLSTLSLSFSSMSLSFKG